MRGQSRAPAAGRIVSDKKEFRPEIEKRITNANRAYYALLLVLKN